MFSRVLYVGGGAGLGILCLAFFLNVPVYLILTEKSTAAFAIILLLLSMSWVLFFLCGGRKALPSLPFGIYFAYLIFATLVITSSAFFSDKYVIEARNAAIWGSVYLISFGAVFALAFHRGHDPRLIFLWGAIVAVLLNVVDYFDQGEYFEVMEGFGVRAAGFFVNANKAAEAILLSMTLSVTCLTKRYRVLFCYFCLVGVVLTFSRGGILGWLLLFVMFIAFDVIYRPTAVLSLLGCFFFSGALLAFFELSSEFVDITKLSDRLDLISEVGNGNVTQDERVGLMVRAFDLFSNSPLFGNGAYSLMRYGNTQLPHNEYLLLGSDFGLIGLFLYGLILYFCWVRGEKLAMLAFIFVLYWGFFTHNILDSYVFCMGLAYLAVLRVQLRRKILFARN